MHKRAAILCLFFMLCAGVVQASRPDGSVAIIPLSADSLPSLNIPRSGHNTFVANGEVVVVGGHTSGFVPTATAEYFSDGAWHVMETVYPHDHGFAVPLRSGQVLIGGGHEQPLGIGHIFSVERYDPVTHSFTGFGCLDHKRCFAQGVEIDSGRVVITGNWYQSGDAIELFDGVKYFTHVKDVSQFRAVPFVFRVSEDDAIIFGSMDHHADPIDTIIVDRLRGEPFCVPLFDEWRPLRVLLESQGADCFIGDEAEGRYAYLFPVENKEGQVAIARFDGSRLAQSPDSAFTLLPTDHPVPMVLEGDAIHWNHAFTIDRQALRAYLFGYGYDSHRLFVLAVNYTDSPAALALYQIEPTGHVVYDRPVLTADGDLLLVGGVELNHNGSADNFTPHASTLLLHLGNRNKQAQNTTGSSRLWLWIGGAALALLLMGVCYRIYKTHRPNRANGSHEPRETYGPNEPNEPHEPKRANEPQTIDSAPSIDLMCQIDQLMDEQQLFRRSGLKLQDVADLLHSNRTYITECIKSARGMSFSQYVNTYRVNYAKELLLKDADRKISAVATDAGFSTEVSFFRAFKTLTGLTPNEFRAQKD